jgi:hypothetical protein
MQGVKVPAGAGFAQILRGFAGNEAPGRGAGQTGKGSPDERAGIDHPVVVVAGRSEAIWR